MALSLKKDSAPNDSFYNKRFNKRFNSAEKIILETKINENKKVSFFLQF